MLNYYRTAPANRYQLLHDAGGWSPIADMYGDRPDGVVLRPDDIGHVRERSRRSLSAVLGERLDTRVPTSPCAEQISRA